MAKAGEAPRQDFSFGGWVTGAGVGTLIAVASQNVDPPLSAALAYSAPVASATAASLWPWLSAVIPAKSTRWAARKESERIVAGLETTAADAKRKLAEPDLVDKARPLYQAILRDCELARVEAMRKRTGIGPATSAKGTKGTRLARRADRRGRTKMLTPIAGPTTNLRPHQPDLRWGTLSSTSSGPTDPPAPPPASPAPAASR